LILTGLYLARYLQHLGAMGYSLLDESAPITNELDLLTKA